MFKKISVFIFVLFLSFSSVLASGRLGDTTARINLRSLFKEQAYIGGYFSQPELLLEEYGQFELLGIINERKKENQTNYSFDGINSSSSLNENNLNFLIRDILYDFIIIDLLSGPNYMENNLIDVNNFEKSEFASFINNFKENTLFNESTKAWESLYKEALIFEKLKKGLIKNIRIIGNSEFQDFEYTFYNFGIIQTNGVTMIDLEKKDDQRDQTNFSVPYTTKLKTNSRQVEHNQIIANFINDRYIPLGIERLLDMSNMPTEFGLPELLYLKDLDNNPMDNQYKLSDEFNEEILQQLEMKIKPYDPNNPETSPIQPSIMKVDKPTIIKTTISYNELRHLGRKLQQIDLSNYKEQLRDILKGQYESKTGNINIQRELDSISPSLSEYLNIYSN